MGQAKHSLEESKDARRASKAKKTAKSDRATFVDMRADKIVKNAVGMFLQRHEDFTPTVENAIADIDMALSLKFSTTDACWVLRISDVDAKWPNITYYTFRHAKVSTLIAHAGYVLTEQWKGVLPREFVKESDLDW